MLQNRAAHAAVLVAALVVATLATAALGGASDERLATGDRAERPTTTTEPPVPTTAPPLVIASNDLEPTPEATAPLPTAGSAGGGGGGGSGGGQPAPSTTAPSSTTSTTTPPPPPREVPPGPAQACGGSVPKPGGGEWSCVFNDEFDGPRLDRSKWLVWTTEDTGWSNARECFVDDPASVAVAGGTLRLSLHRTDQPFTCPHPNPSKSFTSHFKSGFVNTRGIFNLEYGRVEIRAKFPDVSVPGVQSTLWMWPANPTAHLTWGTVSGEIDIAEFFSQYPDRVIPYLHHLSLGGQTTANHCLLDAAGQFHTYVLEWLPNRIQIIYDGKVCLETYSTTSFHEPFFLNLSQLLGQGRNAYQDGTTPPSATTEIDYVRVWR